MSKRARPARVRYYVDADLLGLAKILVQLRTDVTYPETRAGRSEAGAFESPARLRTQRL
jgi:hypothetical protein